MVVALALPPFAAHAAMQTRPPVLQPDTAARIAALDALFSELKRAPTPVEAERISSLIWQAWGNSGSDNIDLMMDWVQASMQRRDYSAALDLLDQIVLLAPDYAEAFNRRATVHFMMKHYAQSMADIGRTLMLEPRHYGALNGMAQIFRIQGNETAALKTYERILDLYPMMRSAQSAVGELADSLAGDRI